MEDYKKVLVKPEFPRSAGYDPDWQLSNQMGPNALWLCEWLCEAMELKPGMRVLDLGCGKAMTSIFLAREFGVRVWAADLWMSQDNNWKRVKEAGAQDSVCPLRMEAHALPFASGFFDAVISIDAYHYFGTDEHYIDYIGQFVREGGQFGVVVPGLVREFENGVVPAHLAEPQSSGKTFWEPACRSFKTPGFWSALWKGSASVEDVKVGLQPDGWRLWMEFERAIEKSGKGIFPSDAEALEKDAGQYIAFIRATARRSALSEMNLYDPTLGLQCGAE